MRANSFDKDDASVFVCFRCRPPQRQQPISYPVFKHNLFDSILAILTRSSARTSPLDRSQVAPLWFLSDQDLKRKKTKVKGTNRKRQEQNVVNRSPVGGKRLKGKRIEIGESRLGLGTFQRFNKETLSCFVKVGRRFMDGTAFVDFSKR